MVIDKNKLENLYEVNKLSSQQIAHLLKCSPNKVNYWLKKYSITKRSIADATYLKNNPLGDPFKFITPLNMQDAVLFGIGLGLYWGEGTKSDKGSVRLGNTDPGLINKFLEFLIKIYNIKTSKLRFGLQLFTDINKQEALRFWSKKLGFPTNHFQKPIVSQLRGKGTYKKRAKYGVLTIYYNNKKLRDLLVAEVEKLRQI